MSKLNKEIVKSYKKRARSTSRNSKTNNKVSKTMIPEISQYVKGYYNNNIIIKPTIFKISQYVKGYNNNNNIINGWITAIRTQDDSYTVTKVDGEAFQFTSNQLQLNDTKPLFEVDSRVIYKDSKYGVVEGHIIIRVDADTFVVKSDHNDDNDDRDNSGTFRAAQLRHFREIPQLTDWISYYSLEKPIGCTTEYAKNKLNEFFNDVNYDVKLPDNINEMDNIREYYQLVSCSTSTTMWPFSKPAEYFKCNYCDCLKRYNNIASHALVYVTANGSILTNASSKCDRQWSRAESNRYNGLIDLVDEDNHIICCKLCAMTFGNLLVQKIGK
jgi:hypothetical protein